MKRYIILILPILLCSWLTSLYIFANFSVDIQNDLKEKYLDIVVNYSIDAAVDEMVECSQDVELDYATWQYVNVDPQIAYNTFVTVFMRNWNLGDSRLASTNRNLVETWYLPCFCVATYDGYYIFEPKRIDRQDGLGSSWESTCSIKQPYLFKTGDNMYVLNLSFDDAKKFDGYSIEKVVPPLSDEDQKYVISASVSDTMMSCIYNQLEQDMHDTVYVPSDMTTFTRTQPISGTTCLAYVSNIETPNGALINSFGIGGARVTHEEFVGCYYRDGMPYYAYTKYIPDGTTIVETYENPTMAAEHGWYADPLCVGY